MLESRNSRERSGQWLSPTGGGDAPVPPNMAAAVFSPLGIPVVIETDRPDHLAVAARSFRGWEGEAEPEARLLRLGVVCVGSPSGAGDVEIRTDGQGLEIAGGGVDAWADAGAGEALCRVSEDHFRDGGRLDEVLDTLILFLLSRSGRTPVHAAGFLVGDMAVILAGPSGSGKSCLALAAVEAGFPLLSDDSVYVQLQPVFRVWGIPRPIHVFPADAPAGSDGPLRRRAGKLKRALPGGRMTGAVAARRAVVCILQSGRKVSLRPVGAAEALSLLDRPEPGFDLIWDDVRAAHRALCAKGAWKLGLSADPAEALRLLAEHRLRLQSKAVP